VVNWPTLHTASKSHSRPRPTAIQAAAHTSHSTATLHAWTLAYLPGRQATGRSSAGEGERKKAELLMSAGEMGRMMSVKRNEAFVAMTGGDYDYDRVHCEARQSGSLRVSKDPLWR